MTDFDGNPVLAAAQRMLPIPAALDVAGMTQSLVHAGIVAAQVHRRSTPPRWPTSTTTGRAALPGRLHAPDSRRWATRTCSTASPLRAFRVQQVLREIVYAARHLPRWRYVPDAALPALLDEGIAIVKPDGFAADVYRKPDVLRGLASTLAAGNPWASVVPTRRRPGGACSEWALRRTRAASPRPGCVRVAWSATSELASSRLLPGWGSGTLVVATSASGGSVETLDALGDSPTG